MEVDTHLKKQVGKSKIESDQKHHLKLCVHFVFLMFQLSQLSYSSSDFIMLHL